MLFWVLQIALKVHQAVVEGRWYQVDRLLHAKVIVG